MRRNPLDQIDPHFKAIFTAYETIEDFITNYERKSNLDLVVSDESPEAVKVDILSYGKAVHLPAENTPDYHLKLEVIRRKLQMAAELETTLPNYLRQFNNFSLDQDTINLLIEDRTGYILESWYNLGRYAQIQVKTLEQRHLEFLMAAISALADGRISKTDKERSSRSWDSRVAASLPDSFLRTLERIKSRLETPISDEYSAYNYVWSEIHKFFDVSTRWELCQRLFKDYFLGSPWSQAGETVWDNWSLTARWQAVVFLKQYVERASSSYFAQTFPEVVPAQDLQRYLLESTVARSVPRDIYDNIGLGSDDDQGSILALGRAIVHGLSAQFHPVRAFSAWGAVSDALKDFYYILNMIKRYDGVISHLSYNRIPAFVELTKIQPKPDVTHLGQLIQLTMRGIPVADTLKLPPTMLVNLINEYRNRNGFIHLIDQKYLTPEQVKLFIPTLTDINGHKDPGGSLTSLSSLIRMLEDPALVAKLDSSIWSLVKPCWDCQIQDFITPVHLADQEHNQHDLAILAGLIKWGVDINILHPWLYTEYDRRRRYHYRPKEVDQEHKTVYGEYLAALWRLFGPNRMRNLDHINCAICEEAIEASLIAQRDGARRIPDPALSLEQLPLLIGCSLENLKALIRLLDEHNLADLRHLTQLKLPVLTAFYKFDDDSRLDVPTLTSPDYNNQSNREILRWLLSIVLKTDDLDDKLTLGNIAEDKPIFQQDVAMLNPVQLLDHAWKVIEILRAATLDYAFKQGGPRFLRRRAEALEDLLANCLWPNLHTYAAANVLKIMKQIHKYKVMPVILGGAEFIPWCRALPAKPIKQILDQLETSILIKGYVREVIRLILNFGPNFKPWLETVIRSDLAKKVGNRLHTGLIVLPIVNVASNDPTKPYADIGPYLLKYKNTLLTKNNYAMLQAIIGAWTDLQPEVKSWAPRDLYREILSHSYPGAENLDLSLEAAQAGVRKASYPKLERRWLNSLSRPDFTPIKPIELNGYRGYFLKRNDPRGLFLGIYTNCCQHPNGAGSSAAWYGQEKANAGFFVVENAQGEIIAQSLVWESIKDSVVSKIRGICFDNCESKGLSPERNQIVADIYAKAARRLLKLPATTVDPRWKHPDHYYWCVNLGLGYGKLRYKKAGKKWRVATDSYQLPLPKDLGYSDADSQVVIAKQKVERPVED